MKSKGMERFGKMALFGLGMVLALPGWAIEPCRIVVVERGNGWRVPLVELRTTYNLRFVTDNAGVIATDAPELMGRETFFHVKSHGYSVPEYGFGYAGVRVTPQPGKTIQLEVRRKNLAKRVGRVTGTGLFAEARQFGDFKGWENGPLVGQDSVLMCRYKEKLFWVWGDTSLYHYPLGVFDSVAATTALQPWQSFKPPLKPSFDYFVDDDGRPRGVAKMPGDGPTWLSAMTTLPDRNGNERLVASYSKIRGYLTPYEHGLVVWNDSTRRFERERVVWREADGDPRPEKWLEGHPTHYVEGEGKEWVLFGNPFPDVRCPATFEAWKKPETWERLEPQHLVQAADSSNEVRPHTGSIAYNSYLKKWITVFMQEGGSPSRLGELWYAEADDPLGEWGPAVKVLTHDNYTFYNPRIHPELTDKDDRFIVFEGTYTAEFADAPSPTPRYNYNQMLYRLDLDDPKLKAAQKKR